MLMKTATSIRLLVMTLVNYHHRKNMTFTKRADMLNVLAMLAEQNNYPLARTYIRRATSTLFGDVALGSCEYHGSKRTPPS